MSELTDSGYQSIREYVQNNWSHIEIYDDAKNAITRVDIDGDVRCQWKDLDSDKTLQVEFSVTGSDGDIPIPTTLKYSAIWDSSTGGYRTTEKEQMAEAVFNQNGDNVVVTHSIDIPQ